MADAIDVVNMVDACELIIQSSLERAESRGPFMRHDFAQDNERWLAPMSCGGPRTIRFEQRLMSCRSSSPLRHQEQSEVAW
jgi:succinate dehydrogenase/fumarate reductase flavoprotein subunit